jgi:hypothetical protein
MEILKSSDDRQVEKKSSIDQYKNFLSVFRQGGWIPISYDVLESLTCDGAASHRAVMTDDESWNGYHYPIAICRRTNGEYLTTDKQGLELKDLPCWQGKGKYEQYVDERRITNADNEGVGIMNSPKYRVGLDYYTCKKTLPAVK